MIKNENHTPTPPAIPEEESEAMNVVGIKEIETPDEIQEKAPQPFGSGLIVDLETQQAYIDEISDPRKVFDDTDPSLKPNESINEEIYQPSISDKPTSRLDDMMILESTEPVEKIATDKPFTTTSKETIPIIEDKTVDKETASADILEEKKEEFVEPEIDYEVQDIETPANEALVEKVAEPEIKHDEKEIDEPTTEPVIDREAIPHTAAKRRVTR